MRFKTLIAGEASDNHDIALTARRRLTLKVGAGLRPGHAAVKATDISCCNRPSIVIVIITPKARENTSSNFSTGEMLRRYYVIHPNASQAAYKHPEHYKLRRATCRRAVVMKPATPDNRQIDVGKPWGRSAWRERARRGGHLSE